MQCGQCAAAARCERAEVWTCPACGEPQGPARGPRAVFAEGPVYARRAAWPWRVAYLLSGALALALPWTFLGVTLDQVEPARLLARAGVGPWLGLRLVSQPWGAEAAWACLLAGPVLLVAALLALGAGYRAPSRPARTRAPRFATLLAAASTLCGALACLVLCGRQVEAALTPLAPFVPPTPLVGSALAILAGVAALPLALHLGLRGWLRRRAGAAEIGPGALALHPGEGGPPRVVFLDELGERRVGSAGLRLQLGRERLSLPFDPGQGEERTLEVYAQLDSGGPLLDRARVDGAASRWEGALLPALVVGGALAAFALQGLAWIPPVVALVLVASAPGLWALQQFARTRLDARRVQFNAAGLLGSRWLSWSEVAQAAWGDEHLALTTREGAPLELSLAGWPAEAREALAGHLALTPREGGPGEAPRRGWARAQGAALCGLALAAGLLLRPPLYAGRKAAGWENSGFVLPGQPCNSYTLISYPFQRAGLLVVGEVSDSLLAGELPPGAERGHAFDAGAGSPGPAFPAQLARDLQWHALRSKGWWRPFEQALPTAGEFWEGLHAGRGSGGALLSCGSLEERLTWRIAGGQVAWVALESDGASAVAEDVHGRGRGSRGGLRWVGLPRGFVRPGFGVPGACIVLEGRLPTVAELEGLARRVEAGEALSAAGGELLPFWRWESPGLPASSARTALLSLYCVTLNARAPLYPKGLQADWIYSFIRAASVRPREEVPVHVAQELGDLLERGVPGTAGELEEALIDAGETPFTPAQRARLDARVEPLQLELLASEGEDEELLGLLSLSRRASMTPALWAALAEGAQDEDGRWARSSTLLSWRLHALGDSSVLPLLREFLDKGLAEGWPLDPLLDGLDRRPRSSGALAPGTPASAALRAALARCLERSSAPAGSSSRSLAEGVRAAEQARLRRRLEELLAQW